jgi:hypothetical protein
MPLPKLGQFVASSGVAIADLGFSKLTDLVASLPQFCRVAGGRVEFLDGEPEVGPTHVRLTGELWRAVVQGEAGKRTWFDLEDQRLVVTVPEGDSPSEPVASAPYRYVAVPAVSRSELLAFLRRWLEQRGVDGRSAQLSDALGASDPLDAVKRALGKQQADALRDAHVQWVVVGVLGWLHTHRILPKRFLHTSPPPYPAASAADRRDFPSRQQPDKADRLRARLHEAIDRMSWAEMAELRVPARLLDPEGG